MVDKPRATGSFDKLEVHTIVPRPTVENTGESRVVFGENPGDTFTFKSGTIVEGLDQAISGNPPDLTGYYDKSEIDELLADKEDASEGETHALQSDVEALDAEDIKAVPAGVQSDYYPSVNGDSNKDIEISSDIQSVGDAIAYNLELTRLLAARTDDAINNATSTNFVSLDTGTWPQSLVTSFAESTPDLSQYNQTQMNSFISLELDKEIKSREETDLQVEINHNAIRDLRVELEALAPTLETGRWTYTSGFGVRPGEIKVGSDSYIVKDEVIILSETDADGSTHGFSNVEEGTYIELVEDDNDYGLYKVVEKKIDVGTFEFTVQLVKGLGAPRDRDSISIRAFESGEVDIESIKITDISDTAPVNPKDGNLWYDNNEDTMQLQVYHKDSDAWIAAAPPSTLSGRVASGEALQSEISEAVVDLQARKLNRAGDTMTGTYTATEGKHLKFGAKDIDDKGKTFIDIVNTAGNGTEGTDYKMHLYHVATPTAPYHAANQKYVDSAVDDAVTDLESQIGAIPDIGAQVEALAELEAKVNAALIDQTRIAYQPPGVKFTYQSGSSGLNEKHFQLWEEGSDTKRIRISTKGVDIDWLDQGINPDYTMNNGPYFTIYYMPTIASASDRVKWRQRWHGRVSRIDWHANDILLHLSSWYSYGSLSAEADYFITIGGIL